MPGRTVPTRDVVGGDLSCKVKIAADNELPLVQCQCADVGECATGAAPQVLPRRAVPARDAIDCRPAGIDEVTASDEFAVEYRKRVHGAIGARAERVPRGS